MVDIPKLNIHMATNRKVAVGEESEGGKMKTLRYEILKLKTEGEVSICRPKAEGMWKNSEEEEQ